MISFLTSSYPRWQGDFVGNFVHAHVQHLRQAGHKVKVIAAGHHALIDNRDACQGGSVHWINGRGVLGQGGGPEALEKGNFWLSSGFLSGEFLLRAIVAARKSEALVAHWMTPAGIAVALASLVVPRPHTVIAHSGDVHLLRRMGLCNLAARLFARAKSDLVFVSHELRDTFVGQLSPTLKASLSRQSRVCPMGVDVAQLGLCAQPFEQREGILMLGRLVDVKGFDRLLSVADNLPACKIVIAGDGPERARLQDMATRIAMHVEMPGTVNESRRNQLLGSARLCVIPSRRLKNGRSEGLPLVALEAMAAGTALVSSGVGGLGQLKTPQRFEADAQLPGVISRLLHNQETWHQQVHEQIREVQEYDWSSVLRRLNARICPSA